VSASDVPSQGSRNTAIIAIAAAPAPLSVLDTNSLMIWTAATLAVLAWLVGLAHHRPAPRPVVARHTFERLARGHRDGHRGTSAA
jgi:hypothetical protein